MPEPRRDDATARMVKRIVIMLALGALAIVAAASLFGLTYYRQYRHKADFSAAIQEVDTERAEREQFEAEVQRQFLAGDFDELDALARELRTSRAEFSNGTWKLTVFYQSLKGPFGSWSEEQWTQAAGLARQWVRERPDSIAARLVAIGLWIDYAWAARGDGWAGSVTPEQWAVYEKRIDEASAMVRDGEGVQEKCPRQASTLLRLALAGGITKAEEAKVFEEAIREHPDYQPTYNSHLLFLLPRWHGAPGEFEKAVHEIAQRPGGKEKLAGAVWFLYTANSFDTSLVAWPAVRQGFADMRARHPESLEIKSAACMFASYYLDRGETTDRLKELGNRMAGGVWRDRDHFAHAYHWATFEQGELAGGDPLARLFTWIFGS